MTTLTVGTDKQFTTVSAAIAASTDGDTILVDAGTYTNDFAHITTDITLTAVGGMVNMVATIPPPDGKAIFTTDGDITINGFSFSGVHVADQNGAGIRMQTGNLVINDCYFHDNEMGILNGGNSSTSTLTIDDSEFAFNGAGGAPGIGHNLYVGNIDTLIVTDSYFHDATVGHEIKSRAANTTITNCRIFDLNSNASYSVDLPNGGNATITGNVIEQGPNSENSYIIEYGGEGMAYASNSLVIDNNVILNDKTTTLPLLFNASSVVPQFDNNEVFGLTLAQLPASQTGTTFLTVEPVLNVSPLCFLSGTMIACPDGERTVETLGIGDLVLTFDGCAVPVKWIGRQTLSPVFGVPEGREPVCIAAGALGDNLPVRDLRLTSDHALLIDNVLVQAGALVNGTTVRRIPPSELGERFVAYHIEMENHEVVLAEGAPAETFIDNVSRRLFDNYAEYEALYGDETPIVELDQPRAMSARQVPRAIRERLAAVATALGYGTATAA